MANTGNSTRHQRYFADAGNEPGATFINRGNDMISISRGAAAASLLLMLSGCVTTNASRLGTASMERAEVAAEDVALYRIASQVPSKYEEVALLNSSGDSGFTNEARMFESMKEKAGEMGANGVILDAVSEPGAGAKVAAAIFGVSAQRKGKAVAIWVFPDGIAPVAASVANEASVEAALVPVATSATVVPVAPAGEPCISCQRIGKSF